MERAAAVALAQLRLTAWPRMRLKLKGGPIDATSSSSNSKRREAASVPNRLTGSSASGPSGVVSASRQLSWL